MLASIPSASLLGATGIPVRVEVHIGKGLPGFRIVGQPDPTCRESRDRVRAAVMSAGHEWPTKCITVNLAPSGPRKIGAGLDLAIAVGVLVASEQLPLGTVDGLGFIGELGLDGSLRRVPGVAPMVAVLGDVDPVVPAASAAEALVASQRHGARGVDAGRGARRPRRSRTVARRSPVEADAVRTTAPVADLADVRGQPVARRALEIAAAGGHHLLMVGSPGSGKTMLAQRLPGLLPPLGRADSLAATMVHSAAGMPMPRGGLVVRPPFRAPHHTTSTIALVGGGSASLRPGEISLEPRRRAVPRRARRVHAGRPRRAARAAGGRRDPGLSRPRPGRAAGAVPARRGHQPVPVRRRAAGLVRVRRRRPAPLHPPAVRAAARSLRPAGRRATSVGRRPPRRRRRRADARSSPARVAAARDLALGSGRAAQRRAPRRAARPPRPADARRAGRAARRDGARSPDRTRLPPGAAGGPHDRRPPPRPGRRRVSRLGESRSPTSRSRCRCGPGSARRRRGWWRDGGERRCHRHAGRARRARPHDGGPPARPARPPRARRRLRRRRRSRRAGTRRSRR